MADNIHALPNAVIPGQQIEPNPEVVQALEDLLQLAREGKIQAIAHAYVANNNDVITGWRFRVERDAYLTSAIHRLAWRWESCAGEGGDVDMPSTRA